MQAYPDIYIPGALLAKYADKFRLKQPYNPLMAPYEAHESFPSSHISGCNILFEQYVQVNGTTADQKLLKCCNPQHSQLLASKYARQFFERVLTWVPQKTTTNQRVYIRMYMNWSGTNDTGNDLLYLAGKCSSRTTFEKRRGELLSAEVERGRKIMVSDMPRVYFCDNFNVAYYTTTQSERGSQVLCSGTGIGVSFNPDEAFVQLDCNKPFCALQMLDPDGFFVQELEDYYFQMNLEHSFTSSPSFKESMFNTPLKPRIDGKDYSVMDYYLPIEINGTNITSDKGMLCILHYLDKTLHKEYSGRIFLKVDVNIFPRFFKFALQNNHYSLHLRKRFGLYLSPWHTYKHALLVLFRSKANFIWLRLWKAAFPNDKTCLLEPSTFQLSLFYNICMVAYAEVYNQISGLKPDEKKITEELNSLRNIFEFFLPAIRDYMYFLRKGDYMGFIEQRRKLLVLFMAGDTSSFYTNGEILAWLVNSYSSRHCRDYCNIYNNNLMLVNEEVGEISFSILARDEYKKGSLFKLKRADASYKNIPLMRRLSKLYRRKDTRAKELRYKNPQSSSPQVLRCVKVFQCIMQELESGNWMHMVPEVSNYAYKIEKAGLRKQMYPTPFPESIPSLLLDVKLPKFLNNFKKKMDDSSKILDSFLSEIDKEY